MSSSSRKQTTIGQQVNLLSVDAEKVQAFFQYFTFLLTMPIPIVISIVYLWHVIGPSCLAGVAVLSFMLIFNGIYLAGKAFELQVCSPLSKCT